MVFVMATHGNFAKGIKESIELILGKFENLEQLSCYTKEDFNIEIEVENLLERNKKKELIVVTDIAGGSVNNIFFSKIEKNKNLHVVSGLNLPLMIELLNEQENYSSAKELVINSLKNVAGEMKYCNLEIKEIEDEEF